VKKRKPGGSSSLTAILADGYNWRFLFSGGGVPGRKLLRANQWGEPINVSNFAGSFVGAQRALGIRPRGVYQTKHTFCSIVVTKTGDWGWLSEQTGV